MATEQRARPSGRATTTITTTTTRRGWSQTDGSVADPVCTLRTEGGHLVAHFTRTDASAEPIGDGSTPAVDGTNPRSDPLRLAHVADLAALRAHHERSVLEAMKAGSISQLAAATQHLLSGVYDAVSCPLLPLVEGLPRVALALSDDLAWALPIETAHRDSEPALFEKTQLYRLEPCGDRRPPVARPRRFLLTFQDAAISDLDVIALEQNLIRWVSSNNRTDPAEVLEPLVHVAGHDPTIPDGLVDPDRRAHVVLSGCRSVPRRLPPGVASAVGSLWDVDDHTSSSIMAAYHARLSLGIGPVESLRQAQLLHRHLPPGAWASYVHVGAPI